MKHTIYSELKEIGKLNRFYDIMNCQNENLQQLNGHSHSSLKNQLKNLSTDKFQKEGGIQSKKSNQYIKDEIFQAQFLSQHSFIIEKYLTIYQHLFQANGYKQTKNLSYQSKDSIQPSVDPINKFMMASPYLTQKEKDFLINKLTEYSKLSIFLEYVINRHAYNYSTPLLKITSCVIKLHELHNLQKKNQNQMIQTVNQIINKKILLSFGAIISGKGQITINDITPDIKMFTIFIINTIVFILQEYYVNPYYQLEEQLSIKEFTNYQIFLYDKTILNFFAYDSDSDEDSSITGRKMIKQDPVKE